ncbi:MAG: hypothetical protein JXK05_10720 [Campylobacterales bacterium]|nr:hypothetical protein [Campylobacterales bacterium]
MNINLFLTLLLGLLIGVYLFFKPTQQMAGAPIEVAQLSLKEFTLYELGFERLVRMLQGSAAERFEDHYEIQDLHVADRSGGLEQELRSRYGRYANDVVWLEGGVAYARADGMAFHSEEASYDINRSLVQTVGAFRVNMQENVIEGERLYLNTKERFMSASSIKAHYLQELP